MSLEPSPKFAQFMRSVWASNAADYAANPSRHESVRSSLGLQVEHINKDDVEARLGTDAAEKWEALRLAAIAFREAVK